MTDPHTVETDWSLDSFRQVGMGPVRQGPSVKKNYEWPEVESCYWWFNFLKLTLTLDRRVVT